MTSDQQLMQKVCKGNHAAFAELVRRHTDRYLALAYRALQNKGDAEDIVQQAFIKLWQNPHSWRSEKSQFTTWFYRVILNACHDFQRKNNRSSPIEINKLDSLLKPVESAQDSLEDKQLGQHQQAMLAKAMAELPSSQRDAINLVVYCALPQKQAAEVLGVSLKALESLLSRARAALIKHVAASISATVQPETLQNLNPA